MKEHEERGPPVWGMFYLYSDIFLIWILTIEG